MNKEQPPKKNEETDPELQKKKDLASWNAWQDWKIMCAVAACSQPESKPILKDQIHWAFWNKFNKIFPSNCGKIMSSSDDWAHVFDTSVYCPEVKKYVDGFSEYADSHPEEAKNHGKLFKDYLWSLIPKREYGSELDFIKGRLIGTGGIINQVVEYYIRNEFPVLFHNWKINKNKKPEDEKKQNLFVESLDQPVGKDKSQTLMDVISADSEYTKSSEISYKHGIDFETLVKSFTWQETACLLAAVTDKLTNKTTMRFIGVNSPAAISRFNNNKDFVRKHSLFKKYMREAGANLEEKKECINLMKKRIRMEKNAGEFLDMIEPVLEKIFEQIDKEYAKKYEKEEK